MAEHDDRDGLLRDELREELAQVVRAELGGEMRCPVCDGPLNSGGRETLRSGRDTPRSGLWEWRAQIYCATDGEHFNQLSTRAAANDDPPEDLGRPRHRAQP